MADPILFGNLRLFRTLNSTEITTQYTRFGFDPDAWATIPTENLDENGDPIPGGWTNEGVVVFPKPAPLDLLGVVNHVRLYAWLSQDHIGSSGPLNLTLSIVGQQVVFAPGTLTINAL